jgi:hypothetical protein
VELMSERPMWASIMLLCLIFLSRLALPNTVQQNGKLTVSSQPGGTATIQINGTSSVDIEVLARLTNPSQGFDGPQINPTPSPASASVRSTTLPLENYLASPRFSKVFMKAGIEEISAIREWGSALLNAVQNGYPVTDAVVEGLQSQATTYLSLASVAASTDSDHQAYQLLSNEFDNMQRLSNKIVAARDNVNYVAPNAIKNDRLYQQVLDCGRSLASMTSHGQFQDDGSCQ